MESHLQGATQAVWVQLQISYETDFCTAATHLAGGGGGGGGGDCSEAIGMCVVAFRVGGPDFPSGSLYSGWPFAFPNSA